MEGVAVRLYLSVEKSVWPFIALEMEQVATYIDLVFENYFADDTTKQMDRASERLNVLTCRKRTFSLFNQ